MLRTSVIGPLLRIVGVGAITGLAVSAALAAPAFASGPNEGTQNAGVATCAEACTAGQPFSSGQVINVTIPANSNFVPYAGQTIQIVECADPGGLVINDPTSINNCDALTAYAESYDVNGDGSVDVTDYPVYYTGGNTFIGDAPGSTPVCNATNYCVLYVGLNDQNFSGVPYFLSQPFLVNPNAANNGADPGDGTPETPLAIGLPLLALGIVSGTLFLKRRRRSTAAAQH